jgi:hypothetical protein
MYVELTELTNIKPSVDGTIGTVNLDSWTSSTVWFCEMSRKLGVSFLKTERPGVSDVGSLEKDDFRHWVLIYSPEYSSGYDHLRRQQAKFPKVVLCNARRWAKSTFK